MTIRTCNCHSPWQDAHYGTGKRVHNETKDGFACTVCGRRETVLKPKATEEAA